MHPHLQPALILPALITLGYLVRVRVKPFKNCRKCRGYGRIHPHTKRGHPRPCRKCGGTGLRPRAFRRPSRAARRLMHDAQSSPRQ